MKKRHIIFIISIIIVLAILFLCYMKLFPRQQQKVEMLPQNQVQTQNINLYFNRGQMLALEKRPIKIKANEENNWQARAKIILEELIKGPKNKELYPTIPQDTKLISVTILNGTATVNLSNEFVTNHIGSTEAETLTIYSIVNSLTELPSINNVSFLINGKKGQDFNDFTIYEPFQRDINLIQK